MEDVNAKEMIETMNVSQLSELVEICRNRIAELRESGVTQLADRFEAMAEAEFGMSAAKVIRDVRRRRKKGRRGRPAANEAAE